MVEETIEAKLKRHEDALVACMAEIERLRAENASLKANNASAHQTLRAIYADSTQPTGHRIRAAQAAIGHESAPLKPTEAPLELSAEPIIPLSQLVEERRRRCDELLALPLSAREALIKGVRRDGGNGGNDTAG